MGAIATNPDPGHQFDSNHWLYGTGATIFGSHDLLRWDTAHNGEPFPDAIKQAVLSNVYSYD